jgi:hypothetical protein
LVARIAERKRYLPVVKAIDTYDIKSLPTEELVVFCVSTTGQGDSPAMFKVKICQVNHWIR